MKRVTLKDIARRVGVTHATVSMALRNQTKISPATRERIQKLAKEMGYVPDPFMGRLNAYRTQTIQTAPHAEIAWINFWKNPNALAKNATFQQYLNGAQDKGKVLGYRVEEMVLHAKDMTPGRIESILHSRNITGLLIPPAENLNLKSVDLSWERYSVIKFGYSMPAIKAHLITNTQFETARLVLGKALSKGFRSIGFHLNARDRDRTYTNFLGGYLVEAFNHPELERIEPLIKPTIDEAVNRQTFIRWYRRYSPKCILTQNDLVASWLSNEGVRIPEDVSIFHFALPASGKTRYSGVQQNSFRIGQEAVVWLDRLIRQGEIGPPDKPLELLVEGEWINGDTG